MIAWWIVALIVLCFALAAVVAGMAILDLAREKKVQRWLRDEIHDAKEDVWFYTAHGKDAEVSAATARLELLREIMRMM